MTAEAKVPLIVQQPAQPVRYNDKYVICWDFSQLSTEDATAEITTLLDDLESAGLHTEVRAGLEQTLLVFVKAPREVLGKAVHKSRIKDWLYSITGKHPGGTNDTIAEGKFEAEDILSMNHLIIWDKSMGGAGITPEHGQWENVKSIFPIHNEAANQALLKRLSTRIALSNEDLDQVRDMFGAKVAFYFAFIQTYTMFLVFPAVTGILTWYFQSTYSLAYAILTCVWCTVVVEWWKLRQTDLALRWDVRNVSGVKVNRAQFKYDKVFKDETGRKQYYFPKWKQAVRQLLQIPFVAVSAMALGVLIVGVFALEILISEGYNGAYKSAIEYVPTIMLALALPRINGYLEVIATAITDFENHRTADYYEMSLTQKNFVLDIITNYLPIFMTAFVYVPFGEDIVPWLSTQSRAMLGAFGKKYLDDGQSFNVDSSRLRDEVVALALTGQVSSFFEENIIPVAKRKFHNWYRNYRATWSQNKRLMVVDDDATETEFLHTVREQSTLDNYNVQEDIAEIVLQFGYLALFSPVWPLISIGFLFNNIIELRTDFIKITQEHQRPAPVRSDGIGPWIDSLDFLTWAGSISTGAIVHLFSEHSIAGGAWWALPITIFISEHIFTGFRSLVRFVLERIGSEQTRKERDERYALRSSVLEEMEAKARSEAMLTVAERDRRKSVRALAGEIFFTKQMERGASTKVGTDLIKAFKEDSMLEGKKPHED